MMRQCYELWLKEREEIVCNYLRQALIGFTCRLKRAYLKFLEYRVKRLEEIKRNIAILTVKKIWRARKLSFKILKEKFIRIKRRKAAMQNKEAYQKYLATLGGPVKVEKKPGSSEGKEGREVKEGKDGEINEDGQNESNDNPEEDKEYKEAQRIKAIIEKRIKEKVSMSKMAYAIDDIDTKVHMPLMQEKALAESLDNDALQSKLFHLTASVFAKGRDLDRSPRRDFARNLQIATPRAVSQRMHYNQSNLPHLLVMAPADTLREQNTPRSYRPVTYEHFLTSTVSTENKMEPPIIPEWKQREYERLRLREEKRKKMYPESESEEEKVSFTNRPVREYKPKERSNHWIPVARRFSTYIPGLDNSSYIPPKWSPLPLDRRILSTASQNVPQKRLSNTAIPPLNFPSLETSTHFSSSTRRRTTQKDVLNSFSPSTQEPSLDFQSLN